MATKKSKPVAKKSSPRKASRLAAKPAKKAPVRKASTKAPAKKAPAKKAAQKAAPARKPASKKAVKAPAKKPVRKAPAKAAVKSAPVRKMAPSSGKVRAFRKEELAQFRAMLQKQLELVQGNLNALAGDNLKRSPLDSTGDISSHSTHMADHGTDNFDRELALSLASSRQDSIYEIEDAIRRLGALISRRLPGPITA